jgi:hypothetical protein
MIRRRRNVFREEIDEMKAHNVLSHLRIISHELEKAIARLDETLHVRKDDLGDDR